MTGVEVIFATVVIVAMVLVLSLKTLSKGYGYKHKVDPLPDQAEEENLSGSQMKEGNR